MEKTKTWARRILKIFLWVFLILLVLFVILVIVRTFHSFDVEKTSVQVIKIHNTKLTMDDVMGKHLPPNPGALADQTVQGVDANNNGIRDDVELAVFDAYPKSAKTRAVLLQYALALQMETIQPFINTTIATEVIREESRADTCLADSLVPRKNPESSRSSSDMEKIDNFISFIEDKQLNTDVRKKADKNFYEYLRSYSDLTNEACDIDVLKL